MVGNAHILSAVRAWERAAEHKSTAIRRKRNFARRELVVKSMDTSAPFSFDPTRSALLSMDYQAGIVYVYGKDPDLTARAASAIQAARSFGMRIIHVKVGFRRDLPEVSARNRLIGPIKNSPEHQKLFEGKAGAIYSAVAPVDDDIVISKTRLNAFVGTDL